MLLLMTKGYNWPDMGREQIENSSLAVEIINAFLSNSSFGGQGFFDDDGIYAASDRKIIAGWSRTLQMRKVALALREMIDQGAIEDRVSLRVNLGWT